MSASSRLPYDNIIDADGHINEPPDLWENYLEPQYRDRALRFRRGADGCDYIEMDGHPSRYFTPDIYSRGYAMGLSFEERSTLARKPYRENIPFGGCDAKERLDLLDREGLAKAILYPTLSLEWEAEVSDPELSLAYCRAYNRWIVDFCADSGGRLIPIAHISLGDGESAAQELRRAVKAGAKGVFISPYTLTNKSHAHPDYDPFWTAAQDLDVPIGLHPVAEPPNRRVYQRFKTCGGRASGGVMCWADKGRSKLSWRCFSGDCLIASPRSKSSSSNQAQDGSGICSIVWMRPTRPLSGRTCH